MNPRALRVNNGPFSRLYIFHVDSPFCSKRVFFAAFTSAGLLPNILELHLKQQRFLILPLTDGLELALKGTNLRDSRSIVTVRAWNLDT